MMDYNIEFLSEKCRELKSRVDELERKIIILQADISCPGCNKYFIIGAKGEYFCILCEREFIVKDRR